MHLLIALLQWLGRMLLGEFREAWAYWNGAWARLRFALVARRLPGPHGSNVGWMTNPPALMRLGFGPGRYVQPAAVPGYRCPGWTERVSQVRRHTIYLIGRNI